ncbi:hypothetical protein GT016_32835, partial [Streptomyces sp. SID3915]|nr:hypothetical protein [Streptomyces sp. SID3915]
GGGALAKVTSDDWQKDESGRGDDHGDKHDSWKHEKPEGGVHTGGGALAMISSDDWQKDKDKDSGSRGDDHGDRSDSGKYGKPEGGV